MQRRDRFLDAIRAVAVVRVVAWHATGAVPLTYVFAAIPTMFFVSGALFSTSAKKRGAASVVKDRMRRLLPPLWVFTAITGVVLAVGAWVSDTSFPVRHVLGWALPLWSPEGTPWEEGRLSSPLWYVRVLLWIVVLGPVLVRLARRRPAITVGVAVAGILALDLLDRRVHLAPSWTVSPLWQMGDLLLYGAFFVIGAAFAERGFPAVKPVRALVLAAIAAGGAALWLATQPVPDAVVNDSHPMHLLVGAAWLLVLLAARGPISRASELPVVRPLVDFISQRSFTIYLWHGVAIFFALKLVDQMPAWSGTGDALVYGGLILAGTTLGVIVFGGVEDLGARRRPTPWPGAARAWRRALPVALACTVAFATIAAVTATTPRDPGRTSVAARLRAPSQAPPRPVNLSRGETVTTFDPARFAARVDRWMRQQDAHDLVVAIDDGTRTWTRVEGDGADGSRRSLDQPLQLDSITKLFTANLVYQAAQAGQLDLDEPFPALAADPSFPYAGRFTVRDVLAHRTGVASYRDAPSYVANPASVVTPEDAINAASAQPLVVPPGTVPFYSSTNFLLLGLLLEQVRGVPYEQQLWDQLLTPMGLQGMVHQASEPGRPNFSTGGLEATPAQLVRAGRGLLEQHVGLDQNMVDLAQVDPDTAMGAGVNGYCPCTDQPGLPHFLSYGYAGSTTMLVWIPSADFVVVLDSSAGVPALGTLLYDLFTTLTR